MVSLCHRTSSNLVKTLRSVPVSDSDSESVYDFSPHIIQLNSLVRGKETKQKRRPFPHLPPDGAKHSLRTNSIKTLNQCIDQHTTDSFISICLLYILVYLLTLSMQVVPMLLEFL